MNLSFKRIRFVISLAKKVNFTVPIPFLFRSIIGFQLRKMYCIARTNVCPDCMFNATCVYGVIFESIVPKNNPALAGRDRISHPIIIDTDEFYGKETDKLVINIIFLGSAILYLPYFYNALLKGGESGVDRDRVTYQVSDIMEVSAAGKERSLRIDNQLIDTQIQPEIWEYKKNIVTKNPRRYMIDLVTPLRFKTDGHYARDLLDSEFARCLHRRTQVLCSQYGHNDFAGEYQFSGEWAVTEKSLRWRDIKHYSARQKKEFSAWRAARQFYAVRKFFAL